jgi:hypothetical protein
MSWFAHARVLALSTLLAAAPVLPSVTETAPAPLTLQQQTDGSIAAALQRPKTVSAGFDVAAFNALLGEEARLAFKTAGPDAATGAYKLTDVSFDLTGDEPMTLFTADELLLWNADIAGLAARFDGKSLDKTIRLFDRIEMSGLKLDMTGYTEAVEDAVITALPDSSAAITNYEEANMDVGRIVLSGMTLHPWTFTETEGEEEGLAAIRLLSAVARSFSLDSMVILDTKLEQSFTESGASGSLIATYDSQIMEGYDRGNIAAMLNGATRFTADFPVPALEAPAATDSEPGAAVEAIIPGEMTSLKMDGSTGYAGWTDVEFANLLSWGERGQLPPITEKDLWSFGNYVIEDMEVSIGDQPFMSAGRLEASADSFVWFLPTRISWSHEDGVFDLGGMMKAIEPLEGAGSNPEGEPSIAEMIGILERTGLSKLSGDGTFALTWNSETGDTLLESKSITDNLYTDETRLSMRLPSYADLVPAFGADGLTPDSELLDELLEAKFVFNSAHYSLSDAGLLDALALLVTEVARFSGEEDPMLAGFAGMAPADLRSAASGLVMFAGAGAASEVPQALDWVKSLSGFIGTGGTFSIRFEPATELTAADIAGIEGGGMAEEPDFAALVDLFGLTITHTPPAEVAAGAP